MLLLATLEPRVVVVIEVTELAATIMEAVTKTTIEAAVEAVVKTVVEAIINCHVITLFLLILLLRLCLLLQCLEVMTKIKILLGLCFLFHC